MFVCMCVCACVRAVRITAESCRVWNKDKECVVSIAQRVEGAENSG